MRAHPVVVNLNMIVSRPGAIPVTIWLAEPIVARDGFVLLHTPPLVASVRLVVDPVHTVLEPLITAGSEFTVTVAVM